MTDFPPVFSMRLFFITAFAVPLVLIGRASFEEDVRNAIMQIFVKTRKCRERDPVCTVESSSASTMRSRPTAFFSLCSVRV